MTVAAPTPTGIPALVDDYALAPRGIFAISFDFLCRQPVGAIGMVLVLIFGLAGIFADWIAPYSPTSNDFASMTEAPSLSPTSLAAICCRASCSARAPPSSSA